ncbi:hypothetical protein SISNIDRAFT_253964 [Sistotremastrum niveocremeum HHB9708]|uniref:G-protein coupled receptors family 1 profile domain-containing protein n=1 Tax=Sistotremastrum niveocremeum HHB9708 TaxID=1314777 RepID=A0A164PJB5_9AGAM|nr:hypothetical protein SISNIDRAFT_253964 [Sistotremastrum niveocremeum HHB9708]
MGFPVGADGFEFGQHPRLIQLIWFSLLIAGQIGLSFLLLTFLLARSTTQRMNVLYNFILLSLIGTPIYLILFYTGQFMTTTPPYTQCLVQAVLKHGYDPAAISSAFFLVLETLMSTIRGPVSSSSGHSHWMLLCLPYLNWMIVSTATAVIGLRFPEKVARGRHSFFCTINDATFGAILTWELVLIAAATLVCQVALGIVVHKRRKACRKLGVPSALNLSQIVRISVFNLWELIGLLLNSAALGEFIGQTMIATSFLAIVPLSVFVIFASQKDIMDFWRCLWQQRMKETPIKDANPELQRVSVKLSSPKYDSCIRERSQAPTASLTETTVQIG